MKLFSKKTYWGTGYFHPSRLIESQHASQLEEAHKEGIKDVAKNMIENNYKTKDIQKITGLTEEEINNLK